MQVTAEDISVISRLVADLCGVVLDESKGYLIKSRLSTIARDAGCRSFTELYYKVRYCDDRALANSIIDAITTKETLFFRDGSPFDALRNKVFPELIDAKTGTAFPRRIRIWSAACSTGQEPYSIAIILHELLPSIHSWDITITATDVSNAAIAQASLGRYDERDIQRGMCSELLPKYFRKEKGGWRVKDEVRALVAFHRANLLEPFAGLGPFDIIFCRNVVIYFSAEARRSLFSRLIDLLTSDGYLFVGSAESLTDLGPEFTPYGHCRALYYRPKKRALDELRAKSTNIASLPTRASSGRAGDSCAGGAAPCANQNSQAMPGS